jgi:glycosyltransferase involved in cell wall biosynthesis
MNITVILCTYNRCQTLARTLDSVATSTLPNSVEWEVLVVDNNSSDQTHEVVDDFCRRYPGRFRYLFERRQGKSYALNTGIREARGEVLAFTDDDVTVEPEWLQHLTAALGRAAQWAGAGGRILPAQTFVQPRWMSLEEPYSLGGALCGLFDFGDDPRKLDRAPYGANMAFRKDMFEKYGGFRTDLGPPPGGEMQGEDGEFGLRLMAAGERLRYEPWAIVHHPVSMDRLKKEYFLAWWFRYGRAQIRMKGKRPPVWGIPRHYLSIPNMIGIHLPKRIARWMRTFNPRRRFFWKCYVWVMVGQIVETYRIARDVTRQERI